MRWLIRRPGAIRTLEGVRRLRSGPIARASGVSIGIRLAGLSLTVAHAIITARLLGPAGYGTTAWVISLAQVVAIAASFGFGALAVREVPTRIALSQQSELAGYLRTALRVTLLLSSLGGILLAAFLWQARGPMIAVGGLLVPLLALVALLRGWGQGFGRVAAAQVPGEIVRPGLLVCIMLVVAALGWRLTVVDYLVGAVAALLAAVLLAAIWLYRREYSRLPHPADSGTGMAAAAAAFPFLCVGLTAVLQMEINTILLGVLAGPRETGLFQPILRFAPLLILPVEAATMRYSPRIAELWKRDERDRVARITATFTWTTSVLTLLVGAAIALAGPWLLPVFGRDFTVSAPLLWIVAGAQLFNAACGPVLPLLTMTGHSMRAFVGQFAGLLASAVLAVLLIPPHGALGATIAMAGGIVTWNGVMLFSVIRVLGINPTITALLFRRSG